MGPLNKLGIFVYYPYIQVELGNLGGIMLRALCTTMIVHSRKLHRKHCSSLYYFLNFIISRCNIIENTYTNHNNFTTQTGINFFVFEEETWSVVQKWCPMRCPRSLKAWCTYPMPLLTLRNPNSGLGEQQGRTHGACNPSIGSLRSHHILREGSLSSYLLWTPNSLI